MKRRPENALTLGSTLVIALLSGTAQAATVRAQLGDHGDYSRLVLSVPKGVEPVAVVDGCVLRISVPDPLRWPLASLRDSFSRRLADFVTADGGRSLTATVHSLGHAAAAGGTLFVEDAGGRTLASVRVPALPAPTDNLPKTARMRVTLPAGAAGVRIALDGNAKEVTMRNNRALLPGGVR